MTILIGLAHGKRDDAAVHLGGLLARSSAEDVVVVSVVQAPWPPNPYRGDKEYLAYQQDQAEIALNRARRQLGASPLGAEFTVRRAESAPAGLLQVAEERHCSSVVVGSSTMGLMGHVMLGGVAERLLHSAELPIVVAPRGFHAGPATIITQVSVAFGRADHDSGLIARSASVARDSCGAKSALFCGAADDSDAGRGREQCRGTGCRRMEAAAGRRHCGSPGIEREIDTRRPRRARGYTRRNGLGSGSSWSAALHDVSWNEGIYWPSGSAADHWADCFFGRARPRSFGLLPSP